MQAPSSAAFPEHESHAHNARGGPAALGARPLGYCPVGPRVPPGDDLAAHELLTFRVPSQPPARRARRVLALHAGKLTQPATAALVANTVGVARESRERDRKWA